tara:strand:- start:8182 stop:9003 length:822 start_codon:yes stop_codon:yes gene_type:complete
MKECVICNAEFEGHFNKKICSPECKKIHLKKYKRQFYEKKYRSPDAQNGTVGNCVICNNKFIKYAKTSKCCGQSCAKELTSIRNKKWRKDNAETLAVKKYEYNKKNRIKLNAMKMGYYYANKPPIVDIQCKECKEYFTPKTRHKHNAFCSRKCSFSNWSKQPKNKLNWAVQDAVRKGLRPKIRIRKSKYLNGLDFTMDELRIHLENQFDDWMNWDNHGLWHIDHIKPVASFNFTSMEDEDFKKCWALENLQPLKDTENMRKNHYFYKAKEMEA